MTKVELFEMIRRDHKIQGKSVRCIAKERGIHRRVVRQALANAVPPERRPLQRQAPTLTEALRLQVRMWLTSDFDAPRKQRHTGRRIWQRLREEHGFEGAESTVKHFVSACRRSLGLKQQAFVPLCHLPAQEAEVDWYEAQVHFPWGSESVQFFQMRACFSGRAFHMAFARQTQQAFLEGHVAAMQYFGVSTAPKHIAIPASGVLYRADASNAL